MISYNYFLHSEITDQWIGMNYPIANPEKFHLIVLYVLQLNWGKEDKAPELLKLCLPHLWLLSSNKQLAFQAITLVHCSTWTVLQSFKQCISIASLWIQVDLKSHTKALITIAGIWLQQKKGNENRIWKNLSIRWMVPLIDKYTMLLTDSHFPAKVRKAY